MAQTHRFAASRAAYRLAADRQTASLAGLAVVLGLVVVSLVLVRQLAVKATIEDCLLAGRQGCDAIVPRAR